jgi:hypothetical protein
LQVVTLEGSLALSRELLREQMQRIADGGGGGGGGGGEMDMPPDGAAEAAFAAPWATAPSDAHSSHMQRVRGLPPKAILRGMIIPFSQAAEDDGAPGAKGGGGTAALATAANKTRKVRNR